MTDNAVMEGMTWDEAICCDEITTVQEFDTYEEAVDAFESGSYDPDLYGVY
jgi:hypothetical protein